MSTPPEHSREGELLAKKYKLEKLLGAGGMGEVYRAQNVLLGRTVAIKVLRPELATNADVVARFVREARAANVARHANIVDVLDIGQDERGAPFIVQEFLEGDDLGRHLEASGGRLAPDVAVKLVRPLAEAVAFAHAKGVVHRDLKPENVLLARVDGTTVPKILDFGISKLASAPQEKRMTATGTAIGTPAYMSPEQVQGARDLDARTDVWALGVMLYELLSGRLPFDAEVQGALFVQICTTEAPRLDAVAPSVPSDLVRIVERCLRKRPQDRYPSAAELARDLAHVETSHAIEPTQRLAPLPADGAPRPVAPRTNERAKTAATQGPGAPASRPSLDAASPAGAATRDRGDRETTATVGTPPVRGEGTLAEQRALRERERTSRPGRDLHISLAPQAPRRSRAAAEPSRNDESTARKTVGLLAAFALFVLGVAGVLTLFSIGAPAWPVTHTASRWIAGTGATMLAAIAVALFLVGASIGVAGVRMYPTSFGHVFAAIGLIGIAYFLGGSAVATQWPDVAGGDGVRAAMPHALPIAVALLPFGLAVYAFRAALESWVRPVSIGKAFAVFFANLAVIGVYLAIQLARDAR